MTAPLRLLIADDQALVRAGFVTVLGSQPDLEVVAEAADGLEAVHLTAELAPDVAVLDVRMPRMDGTEATRRIAGPSGSGTTRVLVVTTFDLDRSVYEALRAGASGFLLKDARPMELVQAVRVVAAGETLLAPSVTRQLIGRFADRVRPPDAEVGAPGSGPLTAREVDVLLAMADGMSNAEIAAALVVSTETVKTYVSRILAKLQVRDRVQAVVWAYRSGLVRT